MAVWDKPTEDFPRSLAQEFSEAGARRRVAFIVDLRDFAARNATGVPPVRATLLVHNVLIEPEWNAILTPEDWRGPTPMFWSNIAPYGEVRLDMTTRLDIPTAAQTPQPL